MTVRPHTRFGGTAYGLSDTQTARRLRDERDAARNDLAASRRENAQLRAANAVLLRIVGDAIEHALTPDPDEET